jgi:hypothetical protein
VRNTPNWTPPATPGTPCSQALPSPTSTLRRPTAQRRSRCRRSVSGRPSPCCPASPTRASRPSAGTPRALRAPGSSPLRGWPRLTSRCPGLPGSLRPRLASRASCTTRPCCPAPPGSHHRAAPARKLTGMPSVHRQPGEVGGRRAVEPVDDTGPAG